MQIDFHHAVTYILARWAGFDPQEANIIAYSAQYVDDAKHTGFVQFDEGQIYSRIASAHRMIDARNLIAIEDAKTWVPFHFLPGNIPSDGDFKQRIRCVQNSPLAQEMLEECLRVGKTRPDIGLYRLGITMHVYADTWAHKGFAGIDDAINDVSDIRIIAPVGYTKPRASFMSYTLAYLGHAQVDTCPDFPFLHWEYEDSTGNTVVRDNTNDFVDAADKILQFMREYRAQTVTQHNGCTSEQRGYLREKFSVIQSDDEDERHKEWLRLIKTGDVPGIPGENVEYSKDGVHSWKYMALGTTDNSEEDGTPLPYPVGFLNSSWRLFHDALQHHRLFVLTELLPKYGICAA